jgi:hypothetical protein
MKQALSIEQMKHLKELGLDTSDASMCLEWNESDSDNMVVTSMDADTNYDYYHGTYTLQDILGKLPRHINDFGTKNKMHIEPTFAGPWCISYQIGICEPFVFKLSENLLDAAYDMLCWCIENGYVKVGKEEK